MFTGKMYVPSDTSYLGLKSKLENASHLAFWVLRKSPAQSCPLFTIQELGRGRVKRLLLMALALFICSAEWHF